MRHLKCNRCHMEGEEGCWVIGGVAIGNRDMTGSTNQWL